MTYEEALSQMDSLMDNSRSFHEEKGDIWDKDIEALTLAKCAIQKQIPEKPNIYSKFERHCECGAIVKTYQNYCYDCVQALEWGDT